MVDSGLRMYAGESSDERVGRRQAALIDAATALIVEDGGRQLRVEGVCRRAGLVKRYFYESFADIDELIGAVIDGIADGFLAVVVDAVDEAQPARQSMRQAIGAMVDYVTEEPRRATVLFGEMSASESAARFRADAGRRISAAVGALAVRMDKRTRADDPITTLTATMLIGGIFQALLDWIDGQIPMSRDELVEDMTELVLAIGEGAISRAQRRATQRGRRS